MTAINIYPLVRHVLDSSPRTTQISFVFGKGGWQEEKGAER